MLQKKDAERVRRDAEDGESSGGVTPSVPSSSLRSSLSDRSSSTGISSQESST